MMKFLNALDRIVGIAFYAVFIVIAILAWRYDGPFGIITKKGHDGYIALGALIFISCILFDIAMFCWYCYALSRNNYKFTNILKPMLKLPRISFAAIYNWFTAD